jgi:hypothetical protein
LVSEAQKKRRVHPVKEGLISAITAGSILILIAIIFLTYLPVNLFNDIINFFSSIILAEVPNTGVFLPAPVNPASHIQLYQAVFWFSIGVGVIEVVILALRLFFKSSIRKTAETVGDLVYWFGAAVLIITYLINISTINAWFVYWTGILMIFGLSLIARAFVIIAHIWAQKIK